MIMELFRVRCTRHQYDTLTSLTEGTAITAARMHALLPCDAVEVTDGYGKTIDWRESEHGPTIDRENR